MAPRCPRYDGSGLLVRQWDSGTLRTASHNLLFCKGGGGGRKQEAGHWACPQGSLPFALRERRRQGMGSPCNPELCRRSRRQGIGPAHPSAHPLLPLLPLQPCVVQEQEAGRWNCPDAHTSAHRLLPLRPASSPVLCSSSSCGRWGAEPVMCGLALGKDIDLKIFHQQTFIRTTPYEGPCLRILVNNNSS